MSLTTKQAAANTANITDAIDNLAKTIYGPSQVTISGQYIEHAYFYLSVICLSILSETFNKDFIIIIIIFEMVAIS